MGGEFVGRSSNNSINELFLHGRWKNSTDVSVVGVAHDVIKKNIS